MRIAVIAAATITTFFGGICKRATAEPPQPNGPSKLYTAAATEGPHGVSAVEKLVLKDGKREKDLQLRITYPKQPGRFPLLVWSHGAFGSKDAYQPLIGHWVSHGYVCIQPSHSDSRTLGGRPGPTAFLDWQNRPKDVSFILDSLDKIMAGAPGLKDRLDKTRIGVGGHSYGAHTAQLVGGVTTKPRGRSHADKRPAAFLLVSAQGTGTLLDRDSWKGLTRPTMVVTGSKDDSRRTKKPYTWRLEPFKYCPPGDKYLLFIDEAFHGFGGISGPRRFPSSGPNNAQHVSHVRAASLMFWNTFLKDDKSARDYLSSDAFSRATKGEAKITARQNKGE